MRGARVLLVAVVLVVGVVGCGGDDDGGSVATQACVDLKALGNVNAETEDDVRAIAAREGVPDDLRATFLRLADLIGAETQDATDAQTTMFAMRDQCETYEGTE